MTRDILVAVDHSDGARKAFDYAVQFIAHKGEDSSDILHLVHYVKNRDRRKSIIALLGEEHQQTIEKERLLRVEKQRSWLKELAAEAEAKKIMVETHILHGHDARDALVDFTHELKPQMFIIGTRRHGAARRAVEGSLSTYLIHHSMCPVLVVK